MPGASHCICYKRGEQAVDGAQKRNDQRRLNRPGQSTYRKFRQLYIRQPAWHVADDRHDSEDKCSVEP